MWRRIATLITTDLSETPGTLRLLADAVLTLLHEREAAELSRADAAELARYRAAGGRPLLASVLQEWRDTASEAARGGSVFASRLIITLDEIERLKAAFVPRPFPTAPAAYDAHELAALRADAEGRRHAEHLLRTAGEPRPRPVIATELGELSDRLTILETQTRQLRGSVFADNASVSPASAHTLPALRDRYLELARRVISLERFAATTEARRTAAELGAQPAAVEPPPPAAEPHQPEPTGPADAHAKCIGLDNGCVECLKARDAGPRDTDG
jgi:hypothetical protein